jgi:hypothetical protein
MEHDEVGADERVGPAAAVRRRRWPRILATILAVLAGVLLMVIAWWVARFPDAEPAPLAAVQADPRLVVDEDGGDWVLHPATGPGETAVVFYPGAAVPPEAYLATWAPIVVASGVSVHIPSMPVRLAVLDANRAGQIMADHPDIASWWVGGHSLGGAMAATFAGRSEPDELDGLVLFAAYATAGAELAARDDLVVLSVSGTRDGLSTPQDVEERLPLLPADAEVATLDGVSHAQFGAYGAQAGDGVPTVSDEQAIDLIAEAVVPVLAS